MMGGRLHLLHSASAIPPPSDLVTHSRSMLPINTLWHTMSHDETSGFGG
jgi:hypothetical protein